MSTALCSSMGEIDAGLLPAFVAWDRQNPLATAGERQSEEQRGSCGLGLKHSAAGPGSGLLHEENSAGVQSDENDGRYEENAFRQVSVKHLIEFGHV
jgi:hypothetical protein